jgi:EAL domain-containing protein (putative c-di-GMP-specific phosphodiesterase class I)
MSIVDQVECYAQKVVDLKTDGSPKYELLTRPYMLAPGQSIESYFSAMDGKTQLEIVEWQMSIAAVVYEHDDGQCALNIDNKILVDLHHQESLINISREYEIPVTFEFTEVHPMPSVDLVNPLFNELRQWGVIPSLDDFGTGFNGMSLFVDYDFDVVKVDRSLVSDLTGRTKKAEVLGLLARMIDTLGKDHVVEGVETKEQLEILENLSFRCFQGYYFHKPEPIENIINHHKCIANV